jgi:glycosyltransferase involved in cell wall biosynthesis
MAMGLPSIVSDIPANRELLNKVLFQPGNPAELAEKIYRLWQDLSLRACLSKEYREIAAEYSIEKFTVRAQSYYSRMASQN